MEFFVDNPLGVRGLGNVLDARSIGYYQDYYATVSFEEDTVAGDTVNVVKMQHNDVNDSRVVDHISVEVPAVDYIVGDVVTLTISAWTNDDSPVPVTEVYVVGVFNGMRDFRERAVTNFNGVAEFNYTLHEAGELSFLCYVFDDNSNVVAENNTVVVNVEENNEEGG